MHHPTFATPDLTTFCRLDELGLEAVGQLLEPDRAVLECRVINDDPWCRKCGAEGVARDTVTRPLAHEPFGHRPTTLLIRVRRYRCAHCRRTWRQDTTKAAAPRAKISRGGIGWALTTIVVDHLTVKEMMRAVIDAVSSGVPAALTEIRRLGRTLKQHAADVLAFFDRPGTSNGPTEAINGRLEHLRGSALGFRNLTHYIARWLHEAGGFRPLLHPRLR
ncbi:transposase [Microbacterium aurantiacum]|uniref:transposase n=1 Tax=Microbacterium aurantiacum TaxID=162393 RepID=UPI003D704C12